MGKTSRFAITGLALLAVASITRAMVVKISGYLANENVAYNKSYPIALNSYGADVLSFMTIASSVTFTNASFTDGQVSTGTIQVVTNTALAATKASNSLNVLTTADPGSGATITVNNFPLVYGVHWFYDASASSNTAASISKAINTYITGVVAATGTLSTVYSTATAGGSFGNSMSLVSNSSTITVTAANFSGGTDPAWLTINGFPVSFTVGATSSNTATSIVNAILSNANLNTVLIATNNTTGTIVYTTSTLVGVTTNFAMFSSTQAALKLGGAVTTSSGTGTSAMQGGADSAYTLVSGSATVINVPNHGFTTALQVLYSTPTGTGITGLVNNTTYYVIPVSAGSLSLASTSANAQAGTALILTSSQTKTATDTFTLKPLAIAGTPSYKWQTSNDGVNWNDYTANSYGVSVPSVSLASYVSTGTVNSWDLGPVDYGWIRLNVTAPTAGAIKLTVAVNGKNSSQ